jgi:MFS family permease
VAPAIPEVRTNRSGFSDISSLSAPSVEVPGDDHGEDGICGLIKEVPSTDPQDDLRANDWSLLWRNYGARLLGTSLSWLLWDVAFYGNKLFQSSFLLALTGEQTTLLGLALAATLNSFVALLGYFGAAVVLDHPKAGRCRLQAWGFLLTGCLFVGCGLLYNRLSPAVLVIMYLGSSFFGQLGPNATTFLIPAEVFPTEMRTVCHGISAASGKLGALMAAVAFHHVSDMDMFLLSGYASLTACAITFWLIPETTSLDLYETDRRWRLILDGRKGEYEGEANHARFLSFYERYKLRIQQRRNDSRAHLDAHFDAGY